MFSKIIVLFCIPKNSVQKFQLLHTLVGFGMVCFFLKMCSSRGLVLFPVYLMCTFCSEWWCQVSFYEHLCPPYLFLDEVSIQLFWLLKMFLVCLSLNYWSSLYIQNSRPLLDICFANIFSKCMPYLFIFLVYFEK